MRIMYPERYLPPPEEALKSLGHIARWAYPDYDTQFRLNETIFDERTYPLIVVSPTYPGALETTEALNVDRLRKYMLDAHWRVKWFFAGEPVVETTLILIKCGYAERSTEAFIPCAFLALTLGQISFWNRLLWDSYGV